MGKKSKSKGGKRPRKTDDSYVESKEFYDGLEHDEKDSYEDAQDREMMSKLQAIQGRNKRHDVSGGIEEMYALSGDSDSEEDDDQEVGEFIETQEEEADDDDVRAWGKRKKHFYGGNPNDTRREDLGDDELDEAEAEEAESKLLQKKQLENLDDEDFFDVFAAPSSEVAPSDHKVEDSVEFDLALLSKKERVSLFHREAPEFRGLLDDFELKMTEVIEKLQPVLTLASEEKISQSGAAMEYIQTKFKLVLTYCVNILAYVMMKTKKVDLKVHPLSKRLVQYKQILEQMKRLDDIVMPQIDEILQSGGDNRKPPMQPKERKKPQKKLKIITKEKPSAPQKEKKQPKSKIEDLTHDERVALEVYEALKTKKNPQEDNDSDLDELEDDDVQAMDQDTEAVPDGEEERRAITYQIAKNKGLQPKRNKLQRNPRVKHRHKFEKAKVRRKGQVREVRKEVKKYGGEVSGINMRVKKGVKLS